jgi:hypothetical protein
MSEIIVLLLILFLAVIGYTVIWGFNLIPYKDKLFAISCSYGLGVGLVCMQLYLYSRIGISWNIWSVLSPWAILIPIILFKERKRITLSLPKLPKLTVYDKLLLFGIFLALSYVIFEALIRPVAVWDAWAIWLLKAKIFFIDGKINPQILDYVRSDYPLVVSLLGTFIYIILGNVNDTAVLLTSTAFYFFLGLSLFAVIRKKYGITYALLFTFLFATMQNFIRHGGRMEAGQADLPIGYFAFCSTILLLEYIKKSSVRVLVLLNMFLAIGSLVKFEGIPIAIVIEIFIVNHILKHKLYKQFPVLLFWIVPLFDWQIYKKINHLTYAYFIAHPFILSSSKMFNAVWGMIKEMITVKSWYILWISYIYALFSFGIKDKYLFILNVIILSQIGLYIVLYMFTLGNDPESSAERLLVHIAPLVFYYLAIIVDGKLPAFILKTKKR